MPDACETAQWAKPGTFPLQNEPSKKILMSKGCIHGPGVLCGCSAWPSRPPVVLGISSDHGTEPQLPGYQMKQPKPCSLLHNSLLVMLSLEQSQTCPNPCWPDQSCVVETSGLSVASLKGTDCGQRCCVAVPCPFCQLLAPQSTVLGTWWGPCLWAACTVG